MESVCGPHTLAEAFCAEGTAMDLRLFLSSTYKDLREARERVVSLLSAIPGELVRMETFGSDESKPLEYCLAEVRRCNLFVGVYAARYGTVDTRTGLSMTEHEYREARGMLESGSLRGLLLYILDPEAKWQYNLVDTDAERSARLACFKDGLINDHQVTFFRDVDDLSLRVLHDVLRKVGVGLGSAFRPKRASRDVAPVAAAVPVGMEHYTERDARYFHGREDSIAEIVGMIGNSPLVLLIGDSGVGKTSLVHAGLAPKLRSDGWAVACCRPLDRPDEVITKALWGQLMEGVLPASAPLSTALQLIASAHSPRRVLVVLDQFEDAIGHLGGPRTSELLAALSHIHSSPPPNVRMVVCYRGDADPRVGKYWQVVSGSATGLPRHYLEPISGEAAQMVLGEALGPHLAADGGSGREEMVKAITADIQRESAKTYRAGVYPPFLQMVAESLLRASAEKRVPVTDELYRSLGGARELIGRYLLNQLRFVRDYPAEARRILQALASRTMRLRKSAGELSKETDIDATMVEQCLTELTSLRLVRAHEDRWEIVHDYVAQRVVEDLSDPAEVEARTFRELLLATAAAFDTTGELLSPSEHLAVYSHRRRITCSPEEVRLLFAGFLAGHGPVTYYLRDLPPEQPIRWAEEHLSSETGRIARNACRFLVEQRRAFRLAEVARVFSDHKLQFALAPLIRRFATPEDADVTLLLKLRHKHAEMVAEAAREALERNLRSGSVSSRDRVLRRLLRSKKHHDLRLLCCILSGLAVAQSADGYRAAIEGRSLLTRAHALCALGSIGAEVDIPLLERRLRRVQGRERQICGHSLAVLCQRHGRSARLAKLLGARDRCSVEGALSALDGGRGGTPVECVLGAFRRLPHETAAAVLRSVGPDDRGVLRTFLSGVELSPPSRDLVIALVSVGDASDVRFALQLIANRTEQIEFWNVPRLADVLAEKSDRSLLAWLRPMTESDEFWRYVGEDRADRPLPVADHDNLYLFKRLAGACLASVCGQEEWPLLKRLLFHEYWNVQVAAGRALARFGGERELDDLLSQLRQHPPTLEEWSLESGTMSAACALDERLYASDMPPS